MARPRKQIKAKEPVRIRFKELKNGNKSIYLDIYRNGKRTYEFLKLYIVPETDTSSRVLNEHSMKLANKVKADRIIELTNNEKGVSNTSLYLHMTICNLLEIYAQSLKDNGKTGSAEQIKVVQKSITGYLGDVKLRQVDKSFLLGYANYLRNVYRSHYGRPISATTANGYFIILGAAFNFGVRRDIVKENPLRKLAPTERIRRTESTREYLLIDELKRLIATECPGNQQIRNAFLFSCYCGLRLSDVEGLTWSKLHKDGEQWRVATVMEKTNVPIYLPLSEQAMKYVPERGEGDDTALVFHLPSRSYINNVMHKWAENAGIIKNVTYHVSRHTFATMLLTLGVDIYTVSKLLGHKNIATTQIYAKIIDQKKDDAVNRVNDIFKESIIATI